MVRIYPNKEALNQISKLLSEWKIETKNVKRVYIRANNVAIDMTEDTVSKIPKIECYLKEQGYDNLYVFPNSKSQYKAKMDTLLYESDKPQYTQESVVDTEKKVLNPSLWQGTELKNDVKTHVVMIVNDIVKTFTDEHDVPLTIRNIYLSGSNLGYYYNTYTDIDVHFTVNEFTEELQDLMARHIDTYVKDQHFVGTHPLEFFLMDFEQEKRENIGGIYDVLNDKWLVKPHKIVLPVEDYNACLQIALHYARTFDMIIGEMKRDVIEYRLQDDLEDDLTVSKEIPVEIRNQKWSEIKSNLDAIVLQFNSLKDMRNESFLKEFNQSDVTLTDVDNPLDRSFTTNNIIFKILDRYDYIPVAKEFKYGVHKEMLKDKNLEENRGTYVAKIAEIIDLI